VHDPEEAYTTTRGIRLGRLSIGVYGGKIGGNDLEDVRNSLHSQKLSFDDLVKPHGTSVIIVDAHLLTLEYHQGSIY